MKFRLVIIAVLGFFIFSCAGKSKRPDVYVPKIRIALLPLSNQSNELDAPEIVRDLMRKQLSARNYEVADLGETDEILKENGISEGGQLGALTPQKLGEILKVEKLMYGDIIEYNFVNIGVYRSRVVELEFRLVDSSTGNILWKDEKKVSRKDVSLDKKSARDSFFVGLAEKMAEKIISKPLLPEATEAVRRIAATLPR